MHSAAEARSAQQLSIVVARAASASFRWSAGPSAAGEAELNRVSSRLAL